MTVYLLMETLVADKTERVHSVWANKADAESRLGLWYKTQQKDTWTYRIVEHYVEGTDS
jgi:hypothetical protein